MMKAATLPLALTLFLASAVLCSAQAPPADTAVNEAVMRQAYRISLRQKLQEALTAQQQHDTVRAAKLYDDAWELALKIGPTNIPEVKEHSRTVTYALRRA